MITLTGKGERDWNRRMAKVLGFILSKSSGATSLSLCHKSASILQRREMCLGVLPDFVDRSSDAFTRNSQLMQDLLTQLHSNIDKVLAGGSPEAVKRNRSRNKLLPRERIERLIDPASSFLELSQVIFLLLFHFCKLFRLYSSPANLDLK